MTGREKFLASQSNVAQAMPHSAGKSRGQAEAGRGCGSSSSDRGLHSCPVPGQSWLLWEQKSCFRNRTGVFSVISCLSLSILINLLLKMQACLNCSKELE